jgi:hypothetical protein
MLMLIECQTPMRPRLLACVLHDDDDHALIFIPSRRKTSQPKLKRNRSGEQIFTVVWIACIVETRFDVVPCTLCYSFLTASRRR